MIVRRKLAVARRDLPFMLNAEVERVGSGRRPYRWLDADRDVSWRIAVVGETVVVASEVPAQHCQGEEVRVEGFAPGDDVLAIDRPMNMWIFDLLSRSLNARCAGLLAKLCCRPWRSGVGLRSAGRHPRGRRTGLVAHRRRFRVVCEMR